MTQISREEVLHLAHLSKLELSDKEVESLSTDMTNILSHVEQLEELNTDGIEPTYQVAGLKNVWRDDTTVNDAVDRTGLLSLSPETLDNQVKVPKVL